jgi:hypothetical protein
LFSQIAAQECRLLVIEFAPGIDGLPNVAAIQRTLALEITIQLIH